MKDWISLLKTLVPLLQTLIWSGLILIVIKMFFSQLRELLGAITKWIAAVKSLNIGKDGITLLSGDLGDSDKISKEDKDKVATELAQKREKDYVYEDWHNAAVIAYSEKRHEAALHDLGQALKYAKTKEQTANALSNQGIVLWQLKRSEEAIRIFKQVDERYGKDTGPSIREQVAGALVNQGVVLGELDRSEEALQVSKQVDERYGKDTESGFREQVVSALVNQGIVLGKLGHFEEALQVYKQVNERYGKDTEPGVRGPVVMALFNQGVVLGELGHSKEAIGIYEAVNERYGKDTDPGVRKPVAKALLNQGITLGELGRFEEAIVALRKAEVIFSALGMTEDEQKVRELIEQWEKEKANK